MLVLTRRPNEDISIKNSETNEEIIVSVLGINRNQVKIGIDAPQHIDIARTELLTRNQGDVNGNRL